MVTSEKRIGARAGARHWSANGRRNTRSVSSIAKLPRDWMREGSTRFGGTGVNAAIGVRATTVKAAAEPPHSKVDCPGWAGVLRFDLAMVPEIVGERDE